MVELTRRRVLLGAGAAAVAAGTGLVVRYEVRDGRGGLPVPNPTPGRPSLPEWFERNRAQAHTRLPLATMLEADSPTRESQVRIPAYIAGLGAHVYTRHLKTRDETPLWPSAQALHGITADQAWVQASTRPDGKISTQQIPPATDLLTTAVEMSKSADLVMIAYFTTEFDGRIAAEHPEWVCHQPGGMPNDVAYKGALGTVLDITSPYGDLVAEELAQVIKAGARGIYLDRCLIPPWGDVSDYSLAQYQQETGRTYVPTSPIWNGTNYADWFKVRSYSQPDLDWYEWKNEKIARVLERWRKVIKGADDQAVLIASATNLLAMTRPDASTSWCRHVDSVKSETDSALAPSRRNAIGAAVPVVAAPDDTRALGWAITRDSADGRPFHVWSGVDVSRDEALRWAAAVMTYGGVANLDIYEFSSPVAGVRPKRPYTRAAAAKAVFRLGEALSPFLAYTAVRAEVGVHVSEAARDRLLLGPDGVGAVERLVSLASAASFGTLARAGLTVRTVDDRQLVEPLPGSLRGMVMPCPGTEVVKQNASLQAFLGRGGAVVDRTQLLPWTTPGSAAEARLLSVARPVIDDASVRLISAGRQHLVARSLHSERDNQAGRLILTVCCDFQNLSNGSEDEEVPGLAPARPSASPSVATPPASSVVRGTLRWRTRLVPEAHRATETISGRTLAIHRSGAHSWVSLPPSAYVACVVIE